jgi:hypothetical protein
MLRTMLTLVLLAGTAPLASAEGPVNGYTYVAPSYYLTPPVIVAPPPVVYGPAPVMLARPVYAPVVAVEPAFLHTTVMPYDPVWPYAYSTLPGTYYKERVNASPREVEYKLKTYGPGGRSVYSYEVDAKRNGVVVRERYR